MSGTMACGDPWPWWPYFPPSPYEYPVTHPWPTGRTFTTIVPQLDSPPEGPRLSDDDVERIARRVADLLREAKP